jgi:hypothetical protein
MLKLLRAEFEEAGKDPEKAEIGPWILHDLRRTAATGMARLNIAPHVVDGILNHVSGTIRGVAAMPISKSARLRWKRGGATSRAWSGRREQTWSLLRTDPETLCPRLTPL